jgi:hypothetical protein
MMEMQIFENRNKRVYLFSVGVETIHRVVKGILEYKRKESGRDQAL